MRRFAGNGANGIHVAGNATGVQITETIIGMDTNGKLPLGNGANGILVDFTKRDGPDSWPDVPFMTPGENLQYTVWIVINVNGRWYASGCLQFWRGLDRMDIPTLERRFAGRRQLGEEGPLLRYLRSYTELSDFAEVFVTERHGFVALASGRTSDFVQRDEHWWQAAMQRGSFEGPAEFDSSAGVTALEFDVALRPPNGGRPLGVLKGVLTLRNLGDLVATTETHGGAYLQVVDRRGLILVSQTPAEILQPLPQKTSIPMQPEAAIAVVATPSGDEVVVTQPANQGEWWVVVRQPTRAAYAAARSGVRSVVLGAILLFATSLGMVLALAQRLHRQPQW